MEANQIIKYNFVKFQLCACVYMHLIALTCKYCWQIYSLVDDHGVEVIKM